jgi:hypothetical protein
MPGVQGELMKKTATVAASGYEGWRSAETEIREQKSKPHIRSKSYKK